MTTQRKRKLNLIGNRYDNRYLPFTKLGTYFPEGVDSMTALTKANLDYDYQINEPTAQYKFPDNEQFTLSVKGNYRAVIRPPVVGKYNEPEWIANVTDKYHLVQNKEVAEFIQPLTDEYPVKVAGELGNGRTVFYVLAGTEATIESKDEQLNTYILVKDSKDGSSGLQFGMFAVRVKCMNMQQFSKDVLATYRLRHTDSIRDNAEIVSTAFQQLASTNQYMLTMAHKYMDTSIKDNNFINIISAAYPVPKKHFMADSIDYEALVNSSKWSEKMEYIQRRQDVAFDRIMEMRIKAQDLHVKYNDENPKTANTVWSALQAVTELSTWREGKHADASILLGSRANEVFRAFEYADTLLHN